MSGVIAEIQAEHISSSSFLGETERQEDDQESLSEMNTAWLPTPHHGNGTIRMEETPNQWMVSREILRRKVLMDPLLFRSRSHFKDGDYTLQTKSSSKSEERLRLFRKPCSFLVPCGSFILRKLKNVVGYFGPGLILACVIYWTMTFSSVGTTVVTEPANLDETYSTFCQPDSQFFSGDPQHEINLTTCQLKNQECREMVEVLEEENFNLRQQLNEKFLSLEVGPAAENEEKYEKLVRAVVKFRLDRFCVLKTSFFQYLLGFVVFTISFICCIVKYFK